MLTKQRILPPISTVSTAGKIATACLGAFLLGTTTLYAHAAPFSQSGASFTSVNEGVDGTGHCANGNPAVNCNIYEDKQYVWMNGGPIAASLANGPYFFVVVEPGSQNDVNDGASGNLSDDFDTYTNRTFSVDSGNVSYAGSHNFNSNKIRLASYANTSNPGGVYILAICSLEQGYPVDPNNCDFDAFKVQVAQGLSLSVSKGASGSYDKSYTWQISKDADQTSVTQAGGNVTFNYEVKVSHDSGSVGNIHVTGSIKVSNPNVDSANNTVAVSGVNVTDALSDGTVCSVTDGSGVTLSAAQTDFVYSCDLSTVPSGQLDNKVTATWPEQTLSNGKLLAAGSAEFTYSDINFTETAIDECVSVSDSEKGNLGTVCVGDANPTSFTYSLTWPGVGGTCTDYDNTATFTSNDTGTTSSASQTVTVCVPLDLGVSKTATPAFKRTYGWTIAKSVDKTLVKQVGGSATFNYEVSVSKDSGTDSDWTVSGDIVVSNPNDFVDFTGVNVSDAVDNGGTCTVTDGTDATIPKSDSKTFAYRCTYASAPTANAGVNTATATWDQSALSTPSASAEGTADFTFGTGPTPPNPTVIDDCVSVADSYAGTLGTTCASKTYSYARTIAIPANGCVAYPNTASFTTNTTGSTGSASQSVTVCGPAKTGALTIGYWQNPNGQGIIKAGAATAGVCNSGTWLRQFAPFQDLSATASCSTVASYVTTVIKAANASGAAMNAMLKAQMLATALDVYFSNSALGGNKISAPAPIGGVTIDLTKVCKNISTCSVFENVSSSFGGASSLTVLQMLTYAASRSNVGGGTWYGNVKATQELAKDAFDAINNQVAFSA